MVITDERRTSQGMNKITKKRGKTKGESGKENKKEVVLWGGRWRGKGGQLILMAMKHRGKSQGEWPVINDNTGRTLRESTQTLAQTQSGWVQLEFPASGRHWNSHGVSLKLTEVRSGQEKAKPAFYRQ
ncbi:hypothetical protein ABZX51_011674 [Aspergillus tubingensis]